IAEPLLARFRAAYKHRRPGDARVRCRMGRRRLEDNWRADPEHILALRVDRPERREDDGLEQYRTHQRPPHRSESPRNHRSKEALSEAPGDCVAYGRIEA